MKEVHYSTGATEVKGPGGTGERFIQIGAVNKSVMKFGTRFLGSFDSGQMVKFGKLSEEYGFDFCGFPHDTLFRNTWPIVSIVANRTSRIGLSVHGSIYKGALDETTTLLATLDEISHGRVALSVGEPSPDMLDWFGMKASNPVKRTREAIEVIRRCLRSFEDARFDAFEGNEFRWSDQAYIRFKPYRRDPPIYIYAHTRDFMDLAVEVADGVSPIMYPPESAPNVVGTILNQCRKIDRNPGDLDIVGAVWISVSRDDRKAAADLLKPIVSYFGPLLEEEELRTIGLSLSDFAEIKRENDRGRYDIAREPVTDEMLQPWNNRVCLRVCREARQVERNRYQLDILRRAARSGRSRCPKANRKTYPPLATLTL